MAKQYIWRVQNEFGHGPYRGLGNLTETFRLFERTGRTGRAKDRRPAPWLDNGLKELFNEGAVLNPRSMCGFKDLEQYNRWFSTKEMRDVLHHAGYFLAKYQVDGLVSHGETQSLFFPKNAKLVALRACNDAGIKRPRDITVKAAEHFVKKKQALAPA